MTTLDRFRLDGKVALVTGGSRGIGEASAIALAEAGADVAVSSRKLDMLEEVAEKVRTTGQRAIAIEAHLGRMDQLQGVVDRVVEELGRLDILVNNAGTNFFAPAIDMEQKAWDTLMNLDIKGLFFLAQASARVMREQGDGRIVNVSSVSGYRPEVPTGHYSIAKAGIHMATKVMAIEWAEFGIRANCIAPGPIDTRLLNARFELMEPEEIEPAKKASAAGVPLGRWGQPHEIADGVVYLASDASSFVTGQTFAIDGGVLLR